MGCCLHPIVLHGILRSCCTGCNMCSCSASSEDSILQHMCSCSTSGEDGIIQCCNACCRQCTGDDMRSRCASGEDGILQCPNCNIILCTNNVHHSSHPIIRSGRNSIMGCYHLLSKSRWKCIGQSISRM